MALVERQFFATIRLETAPDRFHGSHGHNRVFSPMGEKNRGMIRHRLPIWMGITTAGHHPGQGQITTAVKRHGSSLGEAEQHSLGQGFFPTTELHQSLP